MKIKYTKEFLSKEFLNIKKLLQGWTVHRNPGIPANREIRKKINEYYPDLFLDSGELQFWFLHSKDEIFSSAFCICGNKKSWTQRSYSFTKYCGDRKSVV